MLSFVGSATSLVVGRKSITGTPFSVHVCRRTKNGSTSGRMRVNATAQPIAKWIDKAGESAMATGKILLLGWLMLESARMAMMKITFGGSTISSLAMVSPPVVSHPPLAFLKSARLYIGFWLGEYLMWNPIAKVVTLLVLCAIFAYIGGGLFRAVDPQSAEVDSPLWTAIRAIVNPFEDDFKQNKTRIVSCILAGLGTIYFGILVGMVTQTVEETVNSFQNTRVPVLVSDHTVVAGWNSNIPLALRGRFEKIAILTTKESDEVVGDLRDTIGTGARRFYVRKGSPLLKTDLKRVNASAAHTIVVVPDITYRKDPTNKDVIAKCLALRTNLMDFQGNIVVSVNDDKDAAIIKDILKATKARSVTTLNTEQLQGRFLAQVVLQPGLFDIVYAMTNGQPSATFYTLPPTLIPSKWVGKSFQDIEKLNSDGSNILVGYTDEQGEVHLAAHDDYTITSKSSLVFFGLPNSPTKVPLTARVDLPYTKARSYDKPQNVLICGWRHNVAEMLKELGESLPKKSKLIVLADSELPTLPRKLAKSSVHVIQGKWDDYQNLVKAFEVANIDKVVVLASSSPSESDDKDSDLIADSKSLAGLTYIRKLIRDRQMLDKVDVSVEFWDERTSEISESDNKFANVILPTELASLLIGEVLNKPTHSEIWKELLSQYGREVTIKNAAEYNTDTKQPASFKDLAHNAARRHDDVAIGYVIAEKNLALLNPQNTDRDSPRAWQPNDSLIVLSVN